VQANDDPNRASGAKIAVAKLGEQNKMYYNKEVRPGCCCQRLRAAARQRA
jgi:hypothetical protein